MQKRMLVLTAAAALVALAGGAALAATFTDAVGDVVVVPEGADMTGIELPDITAVDVTNTPDGLVTFRVTLANQTLSPATVIAVVLDTDKNVASGDEDGLEAVIGYVVDILGEGTLAFDRWDGTELAEVAQTAATANFSGGVVTVTVPRSELFDTRGVDFGAAALVLRADAEAAALDIVPDTDELLTYDLEGLPPPSPPRLTATRPNGTPARPHAGKRFAVTSLVTRNDTGARVTSGKVTCVVRVGTARVRAAGRLSLAGARCSMTVPKGAKGRSLQGTMTIQASGGKVKRAFSFRVV
jgi:hypothetical protein